MIPLHKVMRVALLAGSALAAPTVLAFTAEASTPEAPSLKPERPYASRVVSTQDAKRLQDALDAADKGDWSRVRQLQLSAGDETIRDLILWRRASTPGADMTFDELSRALDSLESWPDAHRIRANAESAIIGSTLPLGDRIVWLEASGPRTGEGEVALAEALILSGDTVRGEADLRKAWRERTLPRDTVDRILTDWESRLTQDDMRARVDFLLWTNQ